MGDPLRRTYFSVALFLGVLWFSMVLWAVWIFSPKFLQLFSAPRSRTVFSQLEAAPGVTVPGFEFFLYHTVPGDTFFFLAQKFKLSEETLRSLNEFNNENEPKPDTTLLIPSCDGIFHVVKRGQGLSDIAKAYGVSLAALLKANHKAANGDLYSGEVLYLPGGNYLTNHNIRWLTLRSLTLQKTFTKPTTGRFADGFGDRKDPISGKVRFHAGLDLAPGWGSRVVAAQDGTVIFAGLHAGYGNLIILDHGQGLTTWYGHLDQILVKVRAVVKKGDLIGKVGATGRVTGPHLHFEVRLNDKPQNPLLYLVP